MQRVTHQHQRRQRDARRRLVALRHLRRAFEQEIERLGGFRGRVRPEQRPLSHVLDRIEASFQRAWEAA